MEKIKVKIHRDEYNERKQNNEFTENKYVLYYPDSFIFDRMVSDLNELKYLYDNFSFYLIDGVAKTEKVEFILI